MTKNVYLDESGDLGFNFDKPYRNGGSSRYLTICCIITLEGKAKTLLKRIVKNFYIQFEIESSYEQKGAKLNEEQIEFLQQEMIKFFNKVPSTQVVAITVKKENVKASIRKDANKLYNYMIKLAVLDKVKESEVVNLVRDNRSIKVASGNSLADYLQMELLFTHNSDAQLNDIPSDSKQVKLLLLVDWFTHLIWKEYENKISLLNKQLKDKIQVVELFFS